MSGIIYADLRCLQDPAYRSRGIGYHMSALLRARKLSQLSRWKAIGLVDPGMSLLPSEFASLVDEITSSTNPCRNSDPNVFIDGSPMTHDPRFSIRFQNDQGFIKAAVLYDFIPLDWPGYLPTVASRMEYIARLARIRNFDFFFPISEYTACRLSELLGVAPRRITITGACVRRQLYEIRDHLSGVPSAYDQDPPYFVTLGGDDRRKNTEVAVKAVQRLNHLYGRRIPLKVIGHYTDPYKSDLLRLAGHAEGAGFLEFPLYVPDEEVVSIHAGAIAAIAPSYIEGFSLPVAEAAVCGCPVLASTCAAQIELVDRPEALFSPDDSIELSKKLEVLLHDPALRVSLVASQAHLGPKFHEGAVAARFWNSIELAVQSRSGIAATVKPRKPRLAFVSPYPPDLSAAACYTAMMMEAGQGLFHSDIYTDSERPLKLRGNVKDGGTISAAPLLDRRCDAVVSVLGNSAAHKRVFELFERYGGACILHDVRLTQIYFERLGAEDFRRFAEDLLCLPVSMEDVHLWLQDRNSPSLFAERVIRRASPLIVHTAVQQTLLKKRYGVDADVLTCCATVLLDDKDLTAAARQDIRRRLGIPPDAFLIVSFGDASSASGTDVCISALELLRSWHIPAELYIVGNTDGYKNHLDHLAALFEVAEQIHCGAELADKAVCRDFLIAADAAAQLRPYGFGSPPVPLINCISAGLPTVANDDSAKSCDAPASVATVPDSFSPLLVAEQLALIWETRAHRGSRAEARKPYLETHNFEYYAKRLVEILGTT